ncbi:MAG TPA: hypothetical protein VL988_09055 [Solirubrobacteraceae bacterium]|nr:hypothetical protein [Solirubrobacteraceae bacterium]
MPALERRGADRKNSRPRMQETVQKCRLAADAGLADDVTGYTGCSARRDRVGFVGKGGTTMAALIALVLILAIFGGLGFAVHLLWIVLVIAIVLWLIGFFVGGVEGGGRRWYGR